MSSLDSRFTFSRSSVSTYVSGLPFNQNLVDYSETFDGWFTDGVGSINETLEKNPNNSGFAYGFIESTSVSNHRFGRTGLVIGASQAVTISAYVKAGLRTLVTLGNNQLSNSTVTFQLTGNGSFGTLPANVTSAGISHVGNGWYRCHVVTLAKTDGTLTPIIYAATGTLSSTVLSYQGVDEDYALYVWGVQATTGTELLPYLKTTTQSLSQGPIRFADHNMILRSEELDNTTSWVSTIGGTGVTPVRTANNATAPDGTATADTITFNTAAGTTSSDFSLIAQTFTLGYTGVPVTVSFWIRGTVGGEVILTRWSVAGSNFTKITATTQWQRVSFTQTATSGGDVQIGIRQNISGHGIINASATVELWGVQVNHGSIPLGYKRTTNAADYSTPRFDYDPTTLAPRGLLIEGSATNLCLQSAAVRSSGWTPVGLTTQGPSIPAPDGTSSGVEVVPSNGTVAGNAYSVQSVTASASTSYTLSVWIKPIGTAFNTRIRLTSLPGGTDAITATINNANGTIASLGTGTSWTSVSATSTPYPNGWYRIALTGTTPSGTTQLQMVLLFSGTGDGTTGAYFWGAQLEAGSGASSYIPTGSSTVQRAADSCSIAMSSFAFSQFGGTFFVRADRGNFGVGGERSVIATPYGSGLWLGVFTPNASSVVYLMDWNTTSLTRGFGSTQNKIAYSYGQTTGSGATLQLPVSLAVNGSDAATGTFGNGTSNGANVANPANLLSSPLTLGAVAVSPPYTTSTGAWLNNCIQQLKYWPTRLSDAQLKSLTQ
jgi:hypothetical protein